MNSQIALTDEIINEYSKIKPTEIKSFGELSQILLNMYNGKEAPDDEIEISELDLIKIEKHRFMEYANNVVKGKFDIDNNNREIVANLFKYFTADKSGDYDLNKGIFLQGKTGIGKSDTLQSFQEYLHAKKSKSAFYMFTAREIKLRCIDTPKQISYFINIGNLCIDDLGTEGDMNKIYGNKINVINDILAERYRNRNLLYSKTHITTNFTLQELKQFYDNRTLDRFQEMFTRIEMQGENRRLKH